MLGLDYTNSCGFSNLSNSLNHFNKYSVIVCDYNSNNSMETAYISAHFKYKFKYNELEYSYPNILFDILNTNYIFNMLIVFFILCSSLSSSVVFVSHYVYSSMINQFVDKYNQNKELYDYDPYLFEYLDEFNALKSHVLGVDFLNALKYKYVKHVTPKGEIIMNYNHDYSNFDYYCKKSNIIDFTYLDVVSRIYVVKNDCKKIYIDKCENFDYGLDGEIIDADANADADALANALSSKTKDSCIFYNKLNKKSSSKDAIEYVSNKYKYKGTIEDFYSYCEINKYKISYDNAINDDDAISDVSASSCITFSIIKEEENIGDKCCDLYKTSIGFKEFKQFQKF